MKNQDLNQKVLTEQQKYLDIGLQKIIGMHMVFLHQMILFNHEKVSIGVRLLLLKIASSVANIFLKKEKILVLGNLDAKRDWVMLKIMCWQCIK